MQVSIISRVRCAPEQTGDVEAAELWPDVTERVKLLKVLVSVFLGLKYNSNLFSVVVSGGNPGTGIASGLFEI